MHRDPGWNPERSLLLLDLDAGGDIRCSGVHFGGNRLSSRFAEERRALTNGSECPGHDVLILKLRPIKRRRSPPNRQLTAFGPPATIEIVASWRSLSMLSR